MKYLISIKSPIRYTKKNNDLTIILDYLKLELEKTKSKIDKYYKEWEKVKKIIHDYEYIYYSSYRKKNISIISPVSRAYFKFRELFYDYNILLKNNSTICNLAESPGGFIESIIHLANKEKKLNIYANSLLSRDKSIPVWNNVIRKYKINYLYGSKRNGDLCDFENLLSMINMVGRNTCDLITGDGGFDYSSDYSKQEYNSLRLIYSEIFMALNIQKKGGIFICKIFDTFLYETIDLLYLLNLSYDEVYLHKPKISRNSNSEKYIVCLNFKGYDKKLINMMCHSFKTLKLDINTTTNFHDKILKFIIEYTINQIKSINKGIYIIENNMIDNHPSKNQLQLAIGWCNKYNIKINERCIYLNNQSLFQEDYYHSLRG